METQEGTDIFSSHLKLETQRSPGQLETPMQSVTWGINAMMYWYTAMYHLIMYLDRVIESAQWLWH